MPQKSVVMAPAWLEIVVGMLLLTAPEILVRCLFAATPEGVGAILARFAGVGLFALGVASLPTEVTGSQSRAVLGLFLFNFVVAILLAWVGIVTTFRGVLLWPVVVLHTVIAAALLLQLLTFQTVNLAQKHSEKVVS